MTPVPENDSPLDAERLREALRTVSDPEVGLNIVDLGLVYGVTVAPGRVHVLITMTSPACPMGEMILDDVEATLSALLPASTELDLELTWEPPWEPSMMSDKAREQFGW